MAKPSRYLKLFTRFLENLRIESKHEAATGDARGVKLNLWESQQRVLDGIGNGLDNGVHVFYILKSRQLGVSTVTLAILLFWALIHPRINCALVIDNEGNSAKFRAMLTKYFESFPVGYFGSKITILKNNSKTIEFSNGSAIDFLVAGKSKTTWGESRAYTAALLSEVAKYGKAEGLNSFMETFSETNPIRLYIYESTGHGPNHWQAMWKSAGNDPFTKCRIFVGWWSSQVNRIERKDPRFKVFANSTPSPSEQEKIEAVREQYDYEISSEQLAWYRWRESSDAVSKEMMDEQQPWTAEEAFVLSGMSFFQVRKVAESRAEAVERARAGQGSMWFRYYLGNDFLASKREQIMDQHRASEVELRIWELPVTNGRYVIGVDPAFGRNDNADNFVISVWRCFADKLVQVAEYASHDHSAQQATWVLADIAGKYRDCIINVEINGPGDQVMVELNSLKRQLRATEYNATQGFTNVDDSMLDSARWYLYHRPDSMGAGYAYNFVTSYRTKFPLISGFRDLHVTDMLMINSVFLCDEMYDVTQEGREIGALGSGLHDDRVAAAALAAWAWREWIQSPMMYQNMTYARVMGLTDRRQTAIADILNASIGRALAQREEESPTKTFFEERGLND